MGGSSSTFSTADLAALANIFRTSKASSVKEETNSSSGFHLFEIHSQSAGIGALAIFVVLLAAGLLYLMIKKCGCPCRKHRHTPYATPTNFPSNGTAGLPATATSTYTSSAPIPTPAPYAIQPNCYNQMVGPAAYPVPWTGFNWPGTAYGSYGSPYGFYSPASYSPAPYPAYPTRNTRAILDRPSPSLRPMPEAVPVSSMPPTTWTTASLPQRTIPNGSPRITVFNRQPGRIVEVDVSSSEDDTGTPSGLRHPPTQALGSRPKSLNLAQSPRDQRKPPSPRQSRPSTPPAFPGQDPARALLSPAHGRLLNGPVLGHIPLRARLHLRKKSSGRSFDYLASSYFTFPGPILKF